MAIGEGFAGAEAVGNATCAEKPDAVGGFEARRHIAIFVAVPTDDAFEHLFEEAEHAAVDVGDHGSEEEQRANHPAKARRGRSWGG